MSQRPGHNNSDKEEWEQRNDIVSRSDVLLLINAATEPLYNILHQIKGGINSIKFFGVLIGVLVALMDFLQLVKKL